MGTKSENKLGDPVFLLQFFNALYIAINSPVLSAL